MRCNMLDNLCKTKAICKRLTTRSFTCCKKLYYDRYVIKESDIPDSYYKHQQEIYLERGYGHVELNEKMKQQMAQTIINDQKKSLDKRIEYFTRGLIYIYR